MPHGCEGDRRTEATVRAGVVPLRVLRALVHGVAAPAERLHLLDLVMRDAAAREELALLVVVAHAARDAGRIDRAHDIGPPT